MTWSIDAVKSRLAALGDRLGGRMGQSRTAALAGRLRGVRIPLGALAALGAGLAAGAAIAHGLDSRRRIDAILNPDVPDTPADFETREPGRGRNAHWPWQIPAAGWHDVLWRTGASYLGDRTNFVAGTVAFFAVLSLFPTIAAFVTLYGLFANPVSAWEHLTYVTSVLPPQVAGFIGDEMRRLASADRPTLGLTLAGSLLVSLWTANLAVKALFYGLNITYHEAERRGPIAFNLLGFAFTLSALAFLLVVTGLVVAVPVVLRALGLAEEFGAIASLRWLALLGVYLAALMALYRWGPCRARARWRWLVPGAAFAALGSLALSSLFSWYLSTFADFSRSYGSLGALLGFMMWAWISAQLVLLGAALNAALEHQTACDTTIGEPCALGERGATVADSVGPKAGSKAAIAMTLKHAEALTARLVRRQRGDETR